MRAPEHIGHPLPPHLFQLNLTGAGLTETLKAIWKEPKLEDEEGKKTT